MGNKRQRDIGDRAMRSLIFGLICLVSAFPASAEVVYYCNIVNDVAIKDGEYTTYPASTFKMQVTNPDVRLTGDGFFKDHTYKVDNWGAPHLWEASDKRQLLAFSEPVLNFALVGVDSITAISARCDKS